MNAVLRSSIIGQVSDVCRSYKKNPRIFFFVSNKVILRIFLNELGKEVVIDNVRKNGYYFHSVTLKLGHSRGFKEKGAIIFYLD